ncbi:hypothetical protein PIB30_104140, partial [Stylosanthes scabra]|nr:hypothetical protein [Stylosanthes scabra]
LVFPNPYLRNFVGRIFANFRRCCDASSAACFWRISKSHSRDKRSDARRGSSKSRGAVDEDETRSSKKKKCTVFGGSYRLGGEFQLLPLYKFSECISSSSFLLSNYESDRNGIIDGKEGSYDFWLLCTSPTPLPGLIIMDRDYPSGATICPITYRLDRVSRQLGWDQDPKNVEPAFYPIEDMMKKVLFRRSLPEFDPGLVVSFDRIGGITMDQTRKAPSSNAKVVRRNPPEKPVKPPADSTPPPVSSCSKVLPSSITKARGSSTKIPNTSADPVNVGDEDSQSEDNGASHTDSRSPFPASGSSNLTKESPVVTSC